MRRLALALLFLAILVACQPATTQLTEEQKATIATEVDSIMNEWWAAASSADLDRGMSFILDVPEMAWVANETVLPSRSAIDAYYRPIFASLQRQNVEFAHSRTVVLAPDVVYTIRSGTLVPVDTAGNALPALTFAETTAWVKRDAEWKVLLGHMSVRVPESM